MNICDFWTKKKTNERSGLCRMLQELDCEDDPADDELDDEDDPDDAAAPDLCFLVSGS